MKRLYTKQDVEFNVTSKGSANTCLHGVKQGKPVFLATPEDNPDDVVKAVLASINEKKEHNEDLLKYA